jgi:hypothetical protein
MGIPIVGKRHSFLRNSDIPLHTWPAVEGDDFLGSFVKEYPLFFQGGDRFESIFGSNGDLHRSAGL